MSGSFLRVKLGILSTPADFLLFSFLKINSRDTNLQNKSSSFSNLGFNALFVTVNSTIVEFTPDGKISSFSSLIWLSN